MALSVFSTKSAIISLFLPLFAHIGADPPPPPQWVLFYLFFYFIIQMTSFCSYFPIFRKLKNMLSKTFWFLHVPHDKEAAMDTWSMTQSGCFSVAMVTCFFTNSTDNVKCCHGCRWKYVRRLFFMRNIKNWIISVSMVTSEQSRGGGGGLYFARYPYIWGTMHDTTCEEIALKVNVYNSVCMRLEGMDQNKKKSFWS